MLATLDLDTVHPSAGLAGPSATSPGPGLSPHQASWPARFRVEAEVLRVALGALAPTIEHVGSTAVAGMPARPVIDMLLGVPAPLLVQAFAPRLANFGYLLLPTTGDEPLQPRQLVRRVRGVRTHFVQVVQCNGAAWDRTLLFRDILRHDERVAQQYRILKLDLAGQHGTGTLAYADGKASFMTSVVGA